MWFVTSESRRGRWQSEGGSHAWRRELDLEHPTSPSIEGEHSLHPASTVQGMCGGIFHRTHRALTASPFRRPKPKPGLLKDARGMLPSVSEAQSVTPNQRERALGDCSVLVKLPGVAVEE